MSLPAADPDRPSVGGEARRHEQGSLPSNVRELRPAARRFGEWPITVVSLVILVSLGVAAADHFRRGAVLFAFGMVLAFFLRLLLPTRDAGLLAVRSKPVDLIVLGVLALSVSALAIIVPPPS